jgi:hypothetical protein
MSYPRSDSEERLNDWTYYLRNLDKDVNDY